MSTLSHRTCPVCDDFESGLLQAENEPIMIISNN